MLRDFLKQHIKSQAKFVEVGYAQVEPNHLSAQRTGQIYAQLPANKNIAVLENGQFVKYDYAANANGIGEVNFTGKGEWMLVYNEIKLYREHQLDCEFAMLKDNYGARVYSPLGDGLGQEEYGPTRFWQGNNPNPVKAPGADAAADYSVATGVQDYWEMSDINSEEGGELFKRIRDYKEAMMPAGTSMVPRVLKTNVGDIFTTNCINEDTLAVGDILTPQAADGILAKTGAASAAMQWQVVKVYTLADHQKAVKVMRIA
jgi:hypothetical protein